MKWGKKIKQKLGNKSYNSAMHKLLDVAAALYIPIKARTEVKIRRNNVIYTITVKWRPQSILIDVEKNSDDIDPILDVEYSPNSLSINIYSPITSDDVDYIVSNIPLILTKIYRAIERKI